jgi:hypothetical protein
LVADHSVPRRHAEPPLHFVQMRSPGHALAKRVLHIRHCRVRPVSMMSVAASALTGASDLAWFIGGQSFGGGAETYAPPVGGMLQFDHGFAGNAVGRSKPVGEFKWRGNHASRHYFLR